MTTILPPKPRLYPTRYERVQRLIKEARKPVNPLLLFAQSALKRSPKMSKGVRRSRMRPALMPAPIKYSLIACFVCLSILGVRYCQSHHMGVVSAKHTMGQ